MYICTVGKVSKFFIFQLLGWGLFAVLNVYIALLTNELTKAVVIIDILLAGSGILLTSFFRRYIKQHDWHSLLTEKLTFRVFIALFIQASLYTCWYYILVFILIRDVFDNSNWLSIIGSWISIFMLLALWTIIYFIWHYIENSRASLIKRLQLESSMKDMEIKTMRSNLQPHFIFNSLNSIRALIDEDPELARKAITKISNILRNSITKQEATDTLENELQLVDDYLDLEKIRFEERLHVVKQIDPNSLPIQVPTMMMQTLVENAIKHGISKVEKGGDIHIHTRIEHNQLIIELINTGILDTNEQNENSLGFGLSSSIQRLQYLYGVRASLSISQLDSQHVLVKIILSINP